MISKNIRCTRKSRRYTLKGKGSLIKNDVPRDIDTLCNWIKTTIPLVLKIIPKENTGCTSAGQLGCSVRPKPWITTTTKNSESRIIWRSAEEKFPRGLQDTTKGKSINQISSSGKGFNPKLMRHLRLHQECTSSFNQMTMFPFNTSILLRSMRTTKLLENAMKFKKMLKLMTSKLTP
ncbi:hypothetical protein ACFXTI_035235 [Malus domestica]